jgi:formylglycine-generating enzyme required for sulfatase activity
MIDSGNRGPEAEPKARVFISYSRKDEDFAQELLGGLQIIGFDPFLDKHDIAPGEDWEARLGRLIEAADTVVFVISPDAVASERCAWEVERAETLKKRLLPIVFRHVEEALVPPRLKRLNYIYFDRPFSFVASLQALAAALKVDIDWIREHTRQAELAARWQERGRPKSMLLRGDTLEMCKTWVARRKAGVPEITELQLAFFNASEEAERQSQSAERQQLDQIRAALEAENAAQHERAKALEREKAALRRGQRAFTAAVGLFGCVIVGAVGWWQQAWLKEQYRWWAVMGPTVLTSEQERALTPGQQFSECAHGCPKMIVVPPGRFTMGSPVNEKDRNDDEGPRHLVTIGKSFAVGKFDVTFAEWDACVDAGACSRAPDSGWGRGDRPVISVSWEDVKLYVAWLGRITGKEYRLPSESEWEYAARGRTEPGSYPRYFFGDEESELDQYAWYSQNSGEKTQTVGQKKPNAFGLYDVAGNVWQWVEDNHHLTYKGAPDDGSVWAEGTDGTDTDTSKRVLRGGSCCADQEYLRAAVRGRGNSGG